MDGYEALKFLWIHQTSFGCIFITTRAADSWITLFFLNCSQPESPSNEITYFFLVYLNDGDYIIHNPIN